MREDVVEGLVEFNVRDIKGRERLFFEKYFYKRIYSNIQSWRNRIIDKMIININLFLIIKYIIN